MAEEGSSGGKYSAQDLIERAEQYLQTPDTLELAEKFYSRALELEPNNTSIMDDYAQCLLELGDVEKAAEVLRNSIEQDPDGGYQKYMNFGQLLEGMDALKCFQKGVDLMKSVLPQTTDEDEKQKIKYHLSTAHCSMAEIFMTDCCMEEFAEDECVSLIEQAIEWNYKNVEAYLLRAQCYLAQSNEADALPSILQGYSMWQDWPEDDWPPYAIRVSIAKVLIEVSQVETATELLEKLTHEDDEDAEVWYLLALAYVNFQSEPSDYYYDAEECIEKAIQLLQQGDAPPGALEKSLSLKQAINDGISSLPDMAE